MALGAKGCVMWHYFNPVEIRFGEPALDTAAGLIGGRDYLLVCYGEPAFRSHVMRLAELAGPAALVVDDVAPNPDRRDLAKQCARLGELARLPQVVVALGGGSVIDTAKVLAAAHKGFAPVMDYVETARHGGDLDPLPLIALPTTAGTGSEVTCWATIWDTASGRKHSLAHPGLYPETAVIDPSLMLDKPVPLTRATGLDALSHALESIWNKNANPVSTRHAVFAARTILRDLPPLLAAPRNGDLRGSLAEAALSAGLAFSNTKTAIAHNLSYPVTLDHDSRSRYRLFLHTADDPAVGHHLGRISRRRAERDLRPGSAQGRG